MKATRLSPALLATQFVLFLIAIFVIEYLFEGSESNFAKIITVALVCGAISWLTARVAQGSHRL